MSEKFIIIERKTGRVLAGCKSMSRDEAMTTALGYQDAEAIAEPDTFWIKNHQTGETYSICGQMTALEAAQRGRSCESARGQHWAVYVKMPREKPKSDPINHPAHYTQGKIEPIDVIEDWGLGFSLGNCLKYLARAPHKGTELEDLRKARWYLDRAIQGLESNPEKT